MRIHLYKNEIYKNYRFSDHKSVYGVCFRTATAHRTAGSAAVLNQPLRVYIPLLTQQTDVSR